MACARARTPPVENFRPGQEVKGWGRGRGSEGREGKVRAVDREVREEGRRGEGRGSSSTPDQQYDFARASGS